MGLLYLPDLPAVLADAAVFNPDDGSGSGGFVVHWLNNKDLSFTSSTDLFMLQLRKLSEQQLEQTNDDPLDAPDGSPLKFDFGTAHSLSALNQRKCEWEFHSSRGLITNPADTFIYTDI